MIVFDSVIDREEYGTDLDNFLQSVVTDDELQDEMQRLLDEANEFEATHTSNDIDIYHFNVDLGEEPNGLWNEAVNQFDVVHYYDEQDQELSAVEKFEYSILGYSPSQESAMPDFNDMVFSNAVSVLDNSIEDMIATSAENVGKTTFHFISKCLVFFNNCIVLIANLRRLVMVMPIALHHNIYQMKA